MISEEKIKRINELSKKSREHGLSDIEAAEQSTLRQEYLQSFRDNFENMLKSIKVVNPEDIN